MSMAPRLGFNMARAMGSGKLSGGLTQYPVASGYATALATGDACRLATDGTIIQATNATGTIGVIAGFYYVDSTGAIKIQKYLPASTTAYTGTVNTALVIDDPRTTWTVTTSSPINTKTMFPGALFAMNIVAPDSSLGHSKMTLNNTVIETGSLAVTGTNNAALTGLTNGAAFNISTSINTTPVTITIVTNQTPAQLLALLNAVPGIKATLNASNFLVVTVTDGGNLILADGTSTPLASSNLLVVAGTYLTTVALANAMVIVKEVIATTGSNGTSNPTQLTGADVVEVALVNNPFLLAFA